LVHRVELSRDGLRLSLKVPMPATPAAADGPPSPDAIITRFVPLQIKRRGVELRLVVPGADAQMPKLTWCWLRRSAARAGGLIC
jgi:hypothetical protein